MLEIEDIGTAQMSAIDEGDFVGVQIDALGEKPGLPLFELFHTYGFASRPLSPSADGKGCQAFYGFKGNDGFAWLAHDPRVVSKLPNLRFGESMQYGPAGQFIRCHEDGSISMSTTHDGTFDGRSIFLRISPQVTEASGRKRPALEFVSPWATITVGEEGIHLIHASGARLDLGAIAGLPAPLDAIASYAKLTGGAVSVSGSAVAIGTDGGGTNQAAVAALTALLTTWAALIDAKNPTSPAATTALATALPLISQIGAHV